MENLREFYFEPNFFNAVNLCEMGEQFFKMLRNIVCRPVAYRQARGPRHGPAVRRFVQGPAAAPIRVARGTESHAGQDRHAPMSPIRVA